MNSLFLTALVSLTALLSAAEKAPAAQTQEDGKNQLRNGSFTELDGKGMPKWWTYDLTEKLQQFSGEYTINANEWVAFALHASDAIVGDISLRLVK